MAAYLPWVNLAFNMLVIPALVWVIRLEHRLTRIETLIDTLNHRK